MSYRDRLQPQIIMTSPSGLEFIAKWAGNERSLEKKLGVFKTPGLPGVVVQDLDVEGVVYPLTIFFDGTNNDLEANLFFTACRERGPWTIIHPVHGSKILQLVSVLEAIQPITSGGVTEFRTEWLEISQALGAESASQLAAELAAQVQALQEAAADQLDQTVTLDTADKVGKLKNGTENTVNGFSETLESITSTVAEVQAQVDSIKRGIDAVIFDPLTDVLSLAGQIQTLISTPQLIVTDFKTKVETYSRFADIILGKGPEDASPAGINTAAIQEISLTAALGGIGISSTNAPFGSRQDAIDGVEASTDFFDKITNGLDGIQELYLGQLLGNSYFSQSQSFPDAALTSALTAAFLLRSSFNLATEKRITLTQATNPVMIAMQEYGGPGINDANIDLFYNSNQLTGQETILLPVGKEVRVYL